MSRRKLGDVITIKNGYAFKSSLFNDKNGFPVIRIRDVKPSKTTTFTTEKVSDEYVVRKGDYIIGMDGEFNINRWESLPAYLNQRVCKIDSCSQNIRFVYYLLRIELKRIENKTNSVTVKHISSKQIEEIPFPDYSLEEQNAIIALLDKIAGTINSCDKQLQLFDELIKSRFNEMFDNVETNKKHFIMKRMRDCCKFVGGAQPDKKYFEYKKTDKNIRLIQIRDYKSDRFLTYIPKELARRTCTKSDIMIGRYGPPIFQILCGIDGAYNVALMKAIPSDEFNLDYFRFFLKDDRLLLYLESFSKRTAGQDGIQIDKLNDYPCFVPPIELQNEFACFSKTIENTTSALIQQKKHFEELLEIKVQEYFKI